MPWTAHSKRIIQKGVHPLKTPPLVLSAGLSLACVSLLGGCRPSDHGDGGRSLPAYTLVETFRYEEHSESPLTSVRQIVPALDGSIRVIDRIGHAILSFDRDGNPLPSLGREGRGPGEFSLVERIGLLGDTLWAMDLLLGRVTTFRANGEVIGVRSTSSAVDVPPRVARPSPLFLFPGYRTFFVGALGEGRDSLAFFVERQLTDSKVIAVLDTAPRWWDFDIPGRGLSRSGAMQPFVRYSLLKPDPQGGFIVEIERPVPMGSDVGSYEVSWVGVSDGGRTTAVVTYELKEVSEADIEYALSGFDVSLFVSRGLFPSATAARTSARAGLVIPRFAPGIQNLGAAIEDLSILVAEDRVFVKRWTAGDATHRWDIVTREGLQGTLKSRVNLEILAIRNSEAWAVIEDEFDVPTIVKYAIVPVNADQN
jgi:hypothetical protein